MKLLQRNPGKSEISTFQGNPGFIITEAKPDPSVPSPKHFFENNPQVLLENRFRAKSDGEWASKHLYMEKQNSLKK